MKDVRPWHANSCSSQAVKRVHFSTLPCLFLGLPSKAGALRHRAGLTGVLRLAVLGVINCLSKAAFLRLLVDLGATCLLATAYDEDHCLLATHELSYNRVDQSLFEQ